MPLRFLGIAVLLLAGTASSADTCATGDHPNCPNWVANGMCTSSFYAATKGQYCARACGMCGGTCTDTSTRCPTWVSNGFCASSNYPATYKAANCARSCNLCSLTPTTNCAIVYDDNGANTTDFNAPPMVDYPISMDFTPPRVPKEAFVKTSCTLRFSMGPTTLVGPVGTITGGGAKQAMPAGYTGALTATCTCP